MDHDVRSDETICRRCGAELEAETPEDDDDFPIDKDGNTLPGAEEWDEAGPNAYPKEPRQRGAKL